MNTDRTRLLDELQELSYGFVDSSTLVLKQVKGAMMCKFLSHGIVCHTVRVKNMLLATALWQVGSLGIIDGSDYTIFKNLFDKFSLHIKARQLYTEIKLEQLESSFEHQNQLVA